MFVCDDLGKRCLQSSRSISSESPAVRMDFGELVFSGAFAF